MWSPSRFFDNIISTTLYSIFFFLLLIPFYHFNWKHFCGSIILGFFANVLNDIRKALLFNIGEYEYSEEEEESKNKN